MSCKCYLRAGENPAREELDQFSLLQSRKECEFIKYHVFVERNLGLRGHIA